MEDLNDGNGEDSSTDNDELPPSLRVEEVLLEKTIDAAPKGRGTVRPTRKSRRLAVLSFCNSEKR